MRHLTILGAATALALTSPAYAAGHGYVGFDAGLLMPHDVDFEYDGETVIEAKLKNGYDLDLIGGYDFGYIRLEGELGWKHAAHDEYQLFLQEVEPTTNADGDTDVLSGMVNVLGDFGTDKWSFYGGGGVGLAKVRNRIEVGSEHESFKDSGFAYQLIAGVRYSMNEMIDIGLKYRYFDTAKLSDNDADFDFTSHSIMFSFIYNMGPYAAPPPPPPPPPATQTCPDGSVILATDACPPPPPPPPPPPEPERG